MRFAAGLALCGALVLSSATVPGARAQTSTNSITLQAKLDGVSGPTVNLTVKFFDALTSGTQQGATIPLGDVPVSGGVVSVPISPIDPTVFNGQTRYMEITANGNVLAPRTLVTSVPYAIQASAGGGDATGNFRVPGLISSGQVSGVFLAGVTSSGSSLIGNGSDGTFSNWLGSGQPADFIPSLGHGSPYSGFGFAYGYSIESPIVWFYSFEDRNAFQVRSVDYQEPRTSGTALFTVRRFGGAPHVGIGTEKPQAALDVRGGIIYLEGKVYESDGFRVTTDFINTPQYGYAGIEKNQSTGAGTVWVTDATARTNTIVLDGASGMTTTKTLTITGADVVESFNIAGQKGDGTKPSAGMVVCIDRANPGNLVLSSTPYDKTAAGAISGANGLSAGVIMGKNNDSPFIRGDYPVAMSGRIWVWCDATVQTGEGSIAPGDMLTTSSTPGHAMKAADPSKAFGAVIGKAMTGLKDGKGMVLVLVNLQ